LHLGCRGRGHRARAVKVLAAMAIMPPHHHEQAHQSGDRHHDGGMPRNRAAVTLEEQALRRALHTAPIPDTCAPESGGGLVDQLSAALVLDADQACNLTIGYRPVPGGAGEALHPAEMHRGRLAMWRRIADVIRQHEVHHLPSSATVLEAARLMKTKACGAVVIMSRGNLVCIFTAHDLVHHTDMAPPH